MGASKLLSAISQLAEGSKRGQATTLSVELKVGRDHKELQYSVLEHTVSARDRGLSLGRVALWHRGRQRPESQVSKFTRLCSQAANFSKPPTSISTFIVHCGRNTCSICALEDLDQGRGQIQRLAVRCILYAFANPYSLTTRLALPTSKLVSTL